MKKVDFEHFSRFLMPYRVQVRGKDIYFCVKRVLLEENTYRSDLYVYRNGAARRLTSLGDLGDYRLLPEGILFPARRTEEEKKKAEAGIPETLFYLLPYDGGEAAPFLTVPYYTGDLVPAGEERYFFIAEENAGYLEKLKAADNDPKKAAEAMKEEEDYHVVDEIPFYFNGAGYVNGNRSRLYLYDHGNCRALSGEQQNVCILSSENGKILFSEEDLSGGKMPLQSALFEMDPETLEKKDISFSHEKFCQHSWACTLPDGRVLALIEIPDRFGLNQNPTLMILEEGVWRTVLATGALCFGNTVGSDIKAEGRTDGSGTPVRDGRLWTLDTCSDHTALTLVDLRTGEVSRVNDDEMNITSVDAYGDGFVVTALQGKGGTELYLLSMDGKTEKLTSFNDHLAEEYEYSAPVRLNFTDPEGLELQGWVIPPADYDETKKYPAILDIHGGPKTVYGSCYFHEMQLWSSMGYFVFFCNPVGSDGRGDEFADIRGRYGQRDYRNIMQFTAEVLRQWPAIDPDRVGVTGGSYGGFMTNWIIGHTDRFRAAASQRSISNWISFYNTSDIGYFFAWDQVDGTPWTAVEKMWDQSPLKYADCCRTPTLFIHSDEDYRCPLSEGMQMFTALRDHGVEARMCIFRGENHELSRSGKPKHRIRRLREITGWFDKYLK